MTVFGIGISYGLATLFAMFSGMPIAFALGAVALVSVQAAQGDEAQVLRLGVFDGRHARVACDACDLCSVCGSPLVITRHVYRHSQQPSRLDAPLTVSRHRIATQMSVPRHPRVVNDTAPREVITLSGSRGPQCRARRQAPTTRRAAP